MTIGEFLAAIALVLSGFAELAIQNTYEYIPDVSEVNLHVMNTINCDVLLKYDHLVDNKASANQRKVLKGANAIIKGLEDQHQYSMTIKSSSHTKECLNLKGAKFKFSGHGGEVRTSMPTI